MENSALYHYDLFKAWKLFISIIENYIVLSNIVLSQLSVKGTCLEAPSGSRFFESYKPPVYLPSMSLILKHPFMFHAFFQ